MKPIVQDGEPVLRGIAAHIPEEMFGSAELAEMIKDMAEALDKEQDGVAIAAPQIGIPYRIFLARYDRIATPPPEGAPALVPDVGVYINPEILRASQRRLPMDEGCLSVRTVYGTTMRHDRATVRARAEDGSTFERGGGGILAQIFQHEIDHLNGILFIDHATDLREAKPKGTEHEPEM